MAAPLGQGDPPSLFLLKLLSLSHNFGIWGAEKGVRSEGMA